MSERDKFERIVDEWIGAALARGFASSWHYGELLDQLSGWRPIETAPKDYEVVLLYEPPNAVGQGHCTLDAVRGNPNAWQWVFQATQHGCQPTHWMPMPEPPRGLQPFTGKGDSE